MPVGHVLTQVNVDGFNEKLAGHDVQLVDKILHSWQLELHFIHELFVALR